jgi:hypothetical protein
MNDYRIAAQQGRLKALSSLTKPRRFGPRQMSYGRRTSMADTVIDIVVPERSGASSKKFLIPTAVVFIFAALTT